ncbi:LCP family glycopolymer transferase [Vagococcus vulneris]|uniref:Transcriptional regulator n=1 Tax=Vagococcus vulneris TaxID=1977869 RepID=A0A430A1M8_9ENTE|nr:LCP family protein [Vagococcus vulneris]RSU00267.1 transcriptional regulator [Vagococcus vulneris]
MTTKRSDYQKSKNKQKSPLKKGLLILLIILGIMLMSVGAFLAKSYFDVKGVADKISRPAGGKREYPVGKASKSNVEDGRPFSVLLLGLDTGDFGRKDLGRSDTLMVAAVNPKKEQTTLLSIPRDTRTEIVGYGSVDKINHAYAFGQEAMAMNTTEKLLDIPLDHYIWLNMEGFEELVNAVDGVEINNNFEFKQDGYTFKKGKNRLNGKQALAYTRMRYDDPRGDYGRQDRQREVVSAVADKGLSLTGVKQYRDILKAIENNMQTDLSWDEMIKIAMNYRDSFKKINEETLQGEGVMIDDVSYQEIPEDELLRVQNLLKEQLK